MSVFDLDGNLLRAASWRNFPRAELRSFILDCGDPVIVASDVQPVPKSVEKVAAALGSRVIVPDGVLDWRARRRLLSECAGRTRADPDERRWKNGHEKDAIVAGWYAFKRVRGTIGKLERRLAGQPREFRLAAQQEVLRDRVGVPLAR